MTTHDAMKRIHEAAKTLAATDPETIGSVLEADAYNVAITEMEQALADLRASEKAGVLPIQEEDARKVLRWFSDHVDHYQGHPTVTPTKLEARAQPLLKKLEEFVGEGYREA